ncbi:MAG: glycosyltransferase [Chloroflexi bacterium]|nr:glycosyltransferase [Chloroflexota bacterium]
MSDLPTIRCSIGITAYNEEKNIGRLLDALREQELLHVVIGEIIVVASGCTDGTVDVVRARMATDPRVKLFTQEKREGKTSAINVFLANAHEEICVLESADTLPRSDTIENLVKPFFDSKIGMTGAQKVAANTPDHIIGYFSHLRLKLEHSLCLEIPRLGELIAFRKVLDGIPRDVSMDEAFVEAIVIQRGLEVRYAPDAVVFSMGPQTVNDFIVQRRRNYAGHLHLRHKYGYRVSSLDSGRVMRLAFEEIWGAVRLIGVLGVLATVEFWARLLGTYDYYFRGRKHEVWEIAKTTKQFDADPAQAATDSPGELGKGAAR